MKIEVSGKLINKGVSKKGKPFGQVLTPKPDGLGSDVVLVMLKRDYPIGADVKIVANAYVQICAEV
jgi:hypothetical protein